MAIRDDLADILAGDLNKKTAGKIGRGAFNRFVGMK